MWSILWSRYPLRRIPDHIQRATRCCAGRETADRGWPANASLVIVRPLGVWICIAPGVAALIGMAGGALPLQRGGQAQHVTVRQPALCVSLRRQPMTVGCGFIP